MFTEEETLLNTRQTELCFTEEDQGHRKKMKDQCFFFYHNNSEQKSELLVFSQSDKKKNTGPSFIFLPS